MGRRNEHPREQIRSMAIEAGKNIIVQEGYTSLSARKVARAIGYTVGTLYNVFDNYLDIVLHINAETLDEIKCRVENNLGSKQGIEQIVSIGLSYVDYAKENTNQWSALFEYQNPGSEKLPDWYTEKIESMFALPVKSLAPLFNGDVKRAKLEARIIWGGVHGICMLGLTHRLSHGNDELLQQKVRSLIENYLYGATTTGLSNHPSTAR